MVMAPAFTPAVPFFWERLFSLTKKCHFFFFWLKLVSEKVFVLVRINVGFNVSQEHGILFKGLKLLSKSTNIFPTLFPKILKY